MRKSWRINKKDVEEHSAKKSEDSSTSILALLRNLNLTPQESLVAILVAFVRLGKHSGKKRWEVRQMFNQLAQQFPDEGPPKDQIGNKKGDLGCNFPKKSIKN